MATRSTISVEHLDGTVTTMYCHYDGYLEHTGKILQKHYRDRETVERLVQYGGALVEVPENPEDAELLNNEVQKYEDIDEYRLMFDKEEYNYIYTIGDLWYLVDDGRKFILLNNTLVFVE
jgi:hypothetical protein